ncbi:hypothetical protein A1O3_07621 [Capronia epimyces CBS 606.96]|uniref:Rrn9 domain-containing protein n=1 Tax=Capronia epimyces CBS 606.96 TaxID=1182542 RepID=W9XWH6_9EURO|nr:uncharacterized protein A1O3_07621 [Capronia epimyces CBS 606.96]EXJ81331.1 hypothetical protein A1O3_07621 [Capronia epimyces CBS 606.96]
MDSDSSYVEEPDEKISSTDHLIPSSPPRPSIPGPQHVSKLLPLASTPAIVPSLTNNVFAQGADAQSYFTRPNRYFGPASTWKSWTEEERTVAMGLDRVRSQNLTLHLFNAFHLKRKADESARGRRLKKGRKGKARATSVASTTDGEVAVDHEGTGEHSRLPRSWTAWPMPPDQVPREELLPRVKVDGALRAEDEARPSANLEGWLIATATKLARERWNERQWDDKESGVLQERDMEADKKDADLEVDPASDAEESETESESEQEHEETGVPLFSSRAASDSDESERKTSAQAPREGNRQDDEIDRRPVPLADDDTARQVFLPSARHILSRLDHLLFGLQNARYAYATKPHGTPRGKVFSQTPEDRTSTEVEGQGKSRPASRKRRRSSSVNSDISSASAISGRRTDRAGRLGLRDWSDVVGIAALTGWDPAVVERAGERCARLFDENMLFRTFHEGDGRAGTQSWFTEHLALDSDSSTTSPEASDQVEILAVRTSAPCKVCRQQKSMCQPAELQPQPGGTRSCKNCQVTGNDCSGITVQYNASTNGRGCPHESCPRHTVPFRKQYHLQRHLDSVHRNGLEVERPPGRGRASASASADVSDVDTDFGMSLGPSGPIVCPVPGCPRGKEPFPQGRSLYDHVRRMHPEVDVDTVKQLEAKRRGEHRGKWRDERRKRSVSRRRSSSRNRRVRATSQTGGDGDGDDDDDEYRP